MQISNDPIAQSGTTAGSQLTEIASVLESKTGHARHEAKQKAHQAYDELRQGTRKIVSESGSYLKNVVVEQQHLLVEKLEEYRDAAKTASDKLESEDNTVAAKNIRKAARGLECVADYLRESEPNDLLSDGSRMARKRPELVFGGLFVAGLVLARVMKSSARERRREEQSTDRGPSPVEGNIRPFAGSTTGNRPAAPPVPLSDAPAATIDG